MKQTPRVFNTETEKFIITTHDLKVLGHIRFPSSFPTAVTTTSITTIITVTIIQKANIPNTANQKMLIYAIKIA